MHLWLPAHTHDLCPSDRTSGLISSTWGGIRILTVYIQSDGWRWCTIDWVASFASVITHSRSCRKGLQVVLFLKLVISLIPFVCADSGITAAHRAGQGDRIFFLYGQMSSDDKLYVLGSIWKTRSRSLFVTQIEHEKHVHCMHRGGKCAKAPQTIPLIQLKNVST